MDEDEEFQSVDTRPFHMGRQAYKDGQPISANPFPDAGWPHPEDHPHVMWQDGWRAEERDAGGE